MTGSLEKILYVEDDEDLSEITAMVLEDLGNFEVLRCANGFEALDRVSGFGPDLILMDVMMPGMDGVQTFLKMKEGGLVTGVPVVFMSARVQHHETQSYMEAGAAAVLAKPFDPMTLCEDLCGIWGKCNDRIS